jgi:all-trans-retinol dehydrogenase (NAD+)
MKNLNNKNVLITGAASGIGRLLSFGFAKKGCRLILLDINKEGLKKTTNEINKMETEAFSYICDVSDRDEVYKTADKIKKEAGKVDILINNAGIVSGKPFLECPDNMIQKTIDINITAHFWAVKAFLPEMIKDNCGHIVTISSGAGLIGTAGLADYSASKFAVFGFNEALRMELKKDKIKGVKTTVVCPYFINTGMFEGAKTRFNFLLPILDEKKVARKIINAVNKNKQKLIMPWFVYTLFFLRLLPVGMMDAITSFFGINSSMDEFKGRK